MTWETKSQARNKLAREQGTIFKDWGGRIPVALVYPNTYHVGMSNLGLQCIYGLLNADDRVVCERAFWEGRSMDGVGVPPASIESQRELSEFAVIGFSLTFELDYFNIIGLLRQAKIPLLASERDHRHPLLIAGGPCVMQNPEPLAPIFDAMAIGEGEAILPGLIDVLAQNAEDDRPDLLRKIAAVPGMYLPSLYDVDYHQDGTIARIVTTTDTPAPADANGSCSATEAANACSVARQSAKDLDEHPVHSVVLTPDTELGDMFLVEASRGCSRGCQFCLAGFVFLPNRERSMEGILDVARKGLAYRKRIGLVGAATTDYSRIGELASRLREMGAEVAFSSLRMDSLSDELLKALVESGTKTITLAPEAGSQRLRQLINKRISEDQVLRAVEILGRWKISRLKLYYMVGLPTETSEDVDAIIELTRLIRRSMALQATRPQITLNVGPFIPKAQTPFQREAMMPVRELEGRMNHLRKTLSRDGITVRTEGAEWSEVQGVLARGDRRIAGALMAMRRNSLSEWRRALAEAGLAADFYVRRARAVEEVLPWSFIRSGVRPDFPPLAMRNKKGRESLAVDQSKVECEAGVVKTS